LATWIIRLQTFLYDLKSLRPVIEFRIEFEVNNTLSFLDILLIGPKLAMKEYWKPTHTCCYLHFKSSHPHHLKRRVIHILFSGAKVICQDQNDFNKEIKDIRYDLMLNECLQEFVDFIMKPSRSNCPSSDTIYQDTVIIPYVRGMSEKFRCIKN
jgi:hypothetical protein